MPMHESERNRLVKKLRLLILGQSDMAQAAMGAMTLKERSLNDHAVRCMETGIVVCYARPFNKRNNAGYLCSKWAPEDPSMKEIHDELLDRRDQVYAHTDRTGARDIVNLDEMPGLPSPSYAERYQPLPLALPRIITLAEAQQTRFREVAEEMQERLRT